MKQRKYYFIRQEDVEQLSEMAQDVFARVYKDIQAVRRLQGLCNDAPIPSIVKVESALDAWPYISRHIYRLFDDYEHVGHYKDGNRPNNEEIYYLLQARCFGGDIIYLIQDIDTQELFIMGGGIISVLEEDTKC